VNLSDSRVIVAHLAILLDAFGGEKREEKKKEPSRGLRQLEKKSRVSALPAAVGTGKEVGKFPIPSLFPFPSSPLN